MNLNYWPMFDILLYLSGRMFDLNCDFYKLKNQKQYCPTPSNRNVAKVLDILTIPENPLLPISTDSPVDVARTSPLALTAGAITLFANVLDVAANVNRVFPVESTKL